MFFVFLSLLIFLSVYFIDKIRFNVFTKDYEDAFQLSINDEIISPTAVEGKSFIFHKLESEEQDVQVPKNSVLNLNDDYSLYNSKNEEIEGEITYLADGKYTLEVRNEKYTYIYNLGVDNNFSVEIKSDLSYAAGYLIVNFSDVNEEENISINPSFKSSEEFNIENNEVLIPIDYHTEIGEYDIDFSSDISSINKEVVIREYAFRESHFNVDESVIDESAQSPEEEVLEAYEKANSKVTKEYYYLETGFNIPSTGSTTGDFGDIRYINGATTPTKIHYGVDYANILNTEIYSTAKGEVIFVGFLPAYGNIIVVDHGNGITSHYFHLEQTYVKVGDIVDNNTVIAGMGTTGYSTGVHLHFEIHINGVIVNPYFFINRNLVLI